MMTSNTLRFMLVTVILAVSVRSEAAAQQWSPPSPAERCPSRWGATDERGAANHMKPATVLRALQLVKEGKIYELGRVLEPGMPSILGRSYGMYSMPIPGPPDINHLRGYQELVVSELGHAGTQFDGLAHIAIGDMLYNCVKTDEVVTPRAGFTRLGVENVGAIVTRGVLLDVAAVKGVEMLEAGYEITVADLDAAMKRQGVAIGVGDAVLIHTGWGKLWLKDNAKYNSGWPGVGLTAAAWLAKASPILVGSDNAGIELRPHPNPALAFPVHQLLITANGIFLLENLDLQTLVRANVSEFALVVLPLKMKGATGSTVAPIAVR
ncbi:cyclase family protein [soil metagenome]